MTTAEPTAVRLPVEARATITQLIQEMCIAADAAVLGLETARQLLGKPDELVSITAHVATIGTVAAQLSGCWSDLVTLADQQGVR